MGSKSALVPSTTLNTLFRSFQHVSNIFERFSSSQALFTQLDHQKFVPNRLSLLRGSFICSRTFMYKNINENPSVKSFRKVHQKQSAFKGHFTAEHNPRLFPQERSLKINESRRKWRMGLLAIRKKLFKFMRFRGAALEKRGKASGATMRQQR